MTIYVEYALIDNLVINSLLLFLVNKIMRFDSPKWKIFISSLFGTICSLLTPLLPLIIVNIIKILLAILMPLIIISKPTCKKIIISSLLFLAFTFIFIGFCIAISYTFNIAFVKGENNQLIYNFPVGLALLLCSFIFFLLKQIISYFLKRKHISLFTYKIELINDGIKISTTGFLDTGNLLYDNDTNKPINMINLDAFSRLFPNISLANILLKKNLPLKNSKYIEIKSIGAPQSILVFEIDELNLIIDEKPLHIKSVIMGLSLKDYSKNLDSDCILNYKLIENGVKNNEN